MNGALLGLTDTDGSEICFGAVSSSVLLQIHKAHAGFQFQPTFFDPSFGSGNAPQFDIVLGMAFCKLLDRLRPSALSHTSLSR